MHPSALFQHFSLVSLAAAATADQWRGRSIYQIITDRFALPAGADRNQCNPEAQTWCGGTWNTIRENLDYIQDAGFTAIWISPVSQNYEGPRSAYGDAYHGYWIADASKLNDRFGTSDDLKALSAELHRRDMYLMVDVVANNVMATSATPDFSKYLFKDPSQYHQYCPIDWTNTTSITDCWLGDTKVSLPDINTENPTVIKTYGSWIKWLVEEFSIDGLRIDAARHINPGFWKSFCGESAQVFCMGEVFGEIVDDAASYQDVMDSVLNYPLWNAIVDAFTIPGPQNMSAVSDMLSQIQGRFKDPTLLGNFLENQDIPRWASVSTDPQSLYNAMVLTFFSDGIPVVYYGQEQSLTGSADPYNRAALWPSGYEKTAAYNFTATLNQLRNYLVNTSDWASAPAQVLSTDAHGIVIMKGDVISIVTNIGSPPQNVSVFAATPWASSSSSVDIFTCRQHVIGSNGTVQVQYEKGGVPVVLVSNDLLNAAGMCGTSVPQSAQATANGGFSLHTYTSLRIFLTLSLGVLAYFS
ncbi:glycoside hydrolase family 13 protein [Amylostereum chailletii]|nr:glycoside hydrolase family 13 protein [Amylostereum chailletii]